MQLFAIYLYLFNVYIGLYERHQSLKIKTHKILTYFIEVMHRKLFILLYNFDFERLIAL